MLDEAEIQKYLESNERPSDALVVDVQQHLRDPLAKISALQDKMAGLKSQMQDARRRRAEVEESMDPYKKVLAKIRFIPDDVLRQIFISCLSFDFPYPSVHDPDRPPVLLTQVCRRWRRLATSTPELWTHISVILCPIYPAVDDDDTSTHAAIIRRDVAALLVEAVGRANLIIDWLDRSGELPLSLSINYSSDQWLSSNDHPVVIQAASVIMTAVAMYIQRCQHLRVLITNQQLACLDEHLSLEKISNLQSLDIHIIDNNGLPEARTAIFTSPLLTNLPSLLRLNLGSVYENDHLPYQTSGVWQNLTHLDMKDPVDLLRLAQILEPSMSLISCQMAITVINSSFTNPPQSKTYIMPQLQSMELAFYSYYRDDVTDTWASPILDISAPQLKRLQYRTDTDPYRDAHLQDLAARAIEVSNCVPLSHLLFTSTELAHAEITVSKDANPAITQALRQHGSKILHLYLGQHDHTLESPRKVTSTDNSFRALFVLPEWYPQALDVPLTEIPDTSPEELQKALDDCVCPRLQQLEIMGLVDVSDTDALAFITYRLHLYEYAQTRSKDHADTPLKALKRLRILFCRDRVVDVLEDARRLARAIGVDTKIELDYDAGYYSNAFR